jgi:hypothetical protein
MRAAESLLPFVVFKDEQRSRPERPFEELRVVPSFVEGRARPHGVGPHAH